MSTADERERACHDFLLMRVGYLKLVEQVWRLHDGDGVTLLVGDRVTLRASAMMHAIPLMTVH